MKLLVKIIGWTFVGSVGLIAVIIVALMLISDEQYKEWITAAAGSATGRELVIDGEFNVLIGSQVGILANDIHFANAEWGSRDDMMSAGRLVVLLDVLPLIKGVFDFTIELNGPDILLETNGEGKGNWVFKEAELPLERNTGISRDENGDSFVLPLKPYIRNFQINELIFAFNDGTGGQKIQADVKEFRLYVDGAEIPLSLVATYKGAPIELNGTLGSINDYHSNRETPIFLEGLLNEASLGVKGSIGPLFPQPKAVIDLSLKADSVSTFSSFAGISLPGLQGLDIAVTALADSGRFSAENIKVSIDDSKLSLDATGNIADLAKVAGIDLKAEVRSDQISALIREFELPHDYSLPSSLQLKVGVQGDLNTLSVTDLNLLIKDQGVDVNLTGAISNILVPAGADANLNIQLDSIGIVGGYIGMDLPDLGPLTVSAKVVSPQKDIRVESFHAELADPAMSANILGSIDRIGRSADDSIMVSGIKMKAHVDSDQLKSVVKKLDVEVPVELPASVVIDASVAGSLDKLGVSDLKAVIRDEGVEVNLISTVENVFGPSGLVADIQAAAASTANLSKFAGTELPELGSLELESRVVSAGETYSLEALDLQLAGEGLNAKLTAVIKDLLALAKVGEDPKGYGASGLDVSLKADSPSISKLAQIAGIEIPELGELQLDGHLTSVDNSLGLEVMNATLKSEGMEICASAKVADIISLYGVNATVDARIDSLTYLSPIIHSDLPKTGLWTLNVHAAADKGIDDPTTFSANLEGEGIKVVVGATMPDVKTPDTFQADFVLNAETLSRLGALMNKELPEEGPLKTSGSVFVKPGEYRVDEFLVFWDQAEIRADLKYALPAEAESGRPKLTGQMGINNFDITPLLASSQDNDELIIENPETAQKGVEEVADGTGEEKSSSGRRLFSSEPLSMGVLQEYDIDLKLNTTNVTVSKGFSIDGTVSVTLDQGLLKLGPLDLRGKTGGVGEGLIVLDTREQEAKLDVFLDFVDFVPPQLGGILALDVDLDGSGESMAALMGSLNGRFIATLTDVELEKSMMTRFGAGFFSRINPLGNDTTMLECAVARFDAKDGIVDFTKKIAAQTTEVTWFGSGEINLKTEELDLGVHPKPRKALGSLTNVSLAQLIHIGGTLAEPRVSVDPKDVAKKYASYSAFIATGGLSFLAEKLFENRQANKNQCERILADLEK